MGANHPVVSVRADEDLGRAREQAGERGLLTITGMEELAIRLPPSRTLLSRGTTRGKASASLGFVDLALPLRVGMEMGPSGSASIIANRRFYRSLA